MFGNITEHVEVKIENDCDPLHLPIQIKLEEENSLNGREDIFVIPTYEDLGIKEEPTDFLENQTDESTPNHGSKSEHEDEHSSQSTAESTVQIVQSIESPKLPCTLYATFASVEVIDHKNVVRYRMKCRGCGFTTTDKAEIQSHIRNGRKFKCQVCHKEISNASLAMHSLKCSSDKKNHSFTNSCSEKKKVTVLENTGNKNKKTETENMSEDLQGVTSKRAYKKHKTTPNLTSLQPEESTPQSIQIEQVCNYNPTPNFTNPPSSVPICTTFEKMGTAFEKSDSVVLTNNIETSNIIKKCASCEFKSEKTAEILKHIKNSTTILKCPNCDKQFNTITTLRLHLCNKHNIDKNVKLEIKNQTYKLLCHICKQQLKNYISLNRHLYVIHNILNSRNISNDCYICSKQFDDIMSLKSHLIKIHNITDTVPHCLNCRYKCTIRSGLLHHLRAKHKLNTNRYKCNFCSKSFTKSRSYMSHNRSKHEIRTHSMCHTCGLIFSNNKKFNCGHGTKKL